MCIRDSLVINPVLGAFEYSIMHDCLNGEFVYSGSWVKNSMDSCEFNNRTSVSTETPNSYFEFDFIANEFMLVLIGITMALVLNLFYDYGSQRKALVENMQYTEERLQMILGEISAYLANKEMQRNVWDDICALEKEVQGFIQDAYEYQDNTFHSHPGYYIDYFEMRMKQCNVIHNLHYEMKKIRHMPDEAMIISSYVFDMLVCVKEHTVPTAQLDELHELFAIIRNNSLPKTREEFESRAMLYHILMDLEEFLVFKRRFVDGLDDKKRKLYWDN